MTHNQKIAKRIQKKSFVNFMDKKQYSWVIDRLRSFFCKKKGFYEVPTQHRPSILAACENPFNVAPYIYHGQVFPLPQTGQMWLEDELLSDPEAPGCYCISTSFRDEPEPEEGRHDLIFQMFEFETHGNIEHLIELEIELLEFLGFETPKFSNYKDMIQYFKLSNNTELTSEHETKIYKEFGPVFFLKHFPEYTSPFWNMKRNGDTANKVDVLLCGMETIGSAERSVNADEMRSRFHTISDGKYAKALFAKFTKERVEEELEDFLSFEFIERCGGGIGLNRLIRALETMNLMPDFGKKA